jgi:hypothetical protein
MAISASRPGNMMLEVTPRKLHGVEKENAPSDGKRSNTMT